MFFVSKRLATEEIETCMVYCKIEHYYLLVTKKCLILFLTNKKDIFFSHLKKITLSALILQCDLYNILKVIKLIKTYV